MRLPSEVCDLSTAAEQSLTSPSKVFITCLYALLTCVCGFAPYTQEPGPDARFAIHQQMLGEERASNGLVFWQEGRGKDAFPEGRKEGVHPWKPSKA